MDVARAAEGSMRDAESALDQVIAFAGTTITSDDVATVLGLVGRELLLDIMTAVADEDAAAAFQLAGRAVENGYDLKLVCRELSRLVRDLLLIAVDPSRLSDPELAPESERESLHAIGQRFSRDDLLRAFDVIARAETEIRASAQPRYHFEMALLRWIHLRKLVPIEDVIASLERGGGSGLGSTGRPAASPLGGATRPASSPARPTFGSGNRPDFPRKPGGPQATLARIQDVRSSAAATAKVTAIETAAPEPVTEAHDLPAEFRDRFLADVQRAKATFYGMVVSQAQTVECDGRRLLFTFAPANEHLRAQIEARKSELEAIAQQVAGARVPIVTARGVAPSPETPTIAVPLAPVPPAPGPDADLRTRALADEHVRALLEIFPAEITRVEEIS
jgi:DNA polymerase-3 subunit gamma/tau